MAPGAFGTDRDRETTMRGTRTHVLCQAMSGALVALLAGSAFAQGYPARPIRVIDAFPPGGTTDVVARIIGQKFAENPGQAWVIDSRPGAQGIIGTEIAARATPDGYTLLMYTASHAIHPSVYQKLPYDLLRDFTPVSLTSATTNVLVVNPTVPAKSVKEFVALGRARPGQISFASAGHGSTNQVAMELMANMAGLKMVHVPYKGSAPAMIDVINGQVACIIVPMPIGLPHIRSGKVRPLAVATAKRSAVMPEIPTIAEAGVPGYEATNAHGVLAPSGTPRDIVTRLSTEIARILSLPDVRERLSGLGADPLGTTPQQFDEFIRAEMGKWAKVVKDSGMPLVAW